ncbi:MAG TPA: acyltransferase, partial [Sphingomicrobium sp.]|nr:acyltransferase [Sphingomicrobium sp.]
MILVLLDHAGLAQVSGGYIGVDVFFVLSGFLITGLLLKEAQETGGISIGRFYARRARRLLPAATLVLIATVVLSYEVFGQLRANRVAEDARWAALFASNFRSIQQGTDYLGAQQEPSPLQHFWSLAVEEQFYFVWPLLILLLASAAKGIPIRLKLGV